MLNTSTLKHSMRNSRGTQAKRAWTSRRVLWRAPGGQTACCNELCYASTKCSRRTATKTSGLLLHLQRK